MPLYVHNNTEGTRKVKLYYDTVEEFGEKFPRTSIIVLDSYYSDSTLESTFNYNASITGSIINGWTIPIDTIFNFYNIPVNGSIYVYGTSNVNIYNDPSEYMPKGWYE